MNFPAIPSDWIEIEWAPVFSEPILGSGERMVAGLLGFADGSVVTLPAVSPTTARPLFGSNGAQLAALIDEVLADANACLRSQPDLQTWTLLFEGVEVGGVSKAKGRTAQEALQRVLGSHSYLCALTGGWASDEPGSKADATVTDRANVIVLQGDHGLRVPRARHELHLDASWRVDFDDSTHVTLLEAVLGNVSGQDHSVEQLDGHREAYG